MKKAFLRPVIAIVFILLVILVASNVFWSSSTKAWSEFISPVIPQVNTRLNIGIINVLEPNSTQYYKRAMDSIKCYAQIHGYTNIVIETQNYTVHCPQRDKFFRRHCVTALFLRQFDYLMFIDGDIGVVNPTRKIEEYIDPNSDVTFYDRFYDQEIMAGSFILKNTPYALDFIQGFANYEYELPKSFHGTDNGAIHLYVAKKIFKDRPEEYRVCESVYNISADYGDLFTYTSCIRAVLGAMENFPHIRLLRKGKGWARDSFITNSMWDPVNDFMFHTWKSRTRLTYKKEDLPWKLKYTSKFQWYDPIIGDFDFDKCVPGNYSWNYDTNFITTSEAIAASLAASRERLRTDYYLKLAKISQILKYKD